MMAYLSQVSDKKNLKYFHSPWVAWEVIQLLIVRLVISEIHVLILREPRKVYTSIVHFPT
jgi:hypothetical protein